MFEVKCRAVCVLTILAVSSGVRPRESRVMVQVGRRELATQYFGDRILAS